MLEAPHFLRLTRALALGALAAPALQCTPARSPSAQTAQTAPDPSSGSPQRPTPPQNTPPVASADGAPREGATCDRGGSLVYTAVGRSLQICQCQIPSEQDDMTPPRWVCSSHERATVGLDGRACEELDATRADEGNPSGGSRCVCVAHEGRREYACYLAFNTMAGPLAPPELRA